MQGIQVFLKVESNKETCKPAFVTITTSNRQLCYTIYLEYSISDGVRYVFLGCTCVGILVIGIKLVDSSDSIWSAFGESLVHEKMSLLMFGDQLFVVSI